jgi:hypothetical protein
MDMVWKQKALAINGLGGGLTITIGRDNKWHASAEHVEIGGDGLLTSKCGTGDSIGEAVDDLWEILTVLKPGQMIVVNDTGPGPRQHFRWNGTVWAMVA